MIGPLEHAYLLPRPGETGARRLWRRTARGLLYLAPALVALQRLNQDNHWLPDVFLGYTAGLLTGRTLAAGHSRPASPPAGNATLSRRIPHPFGRRSTNSVTRATRSTFLPSRSNR